MVYVMDLTPDDYDAVYALANRYNCTFPLAIRLSLGFALHHMEELAAELMEATERLETQRRAAPSI